MTQKGLRGSIVLAVSLSYFAYVFQVFGHDFRTSGLSGWLDPYFINYLLEHWYHSLWSLSNPASPPMFFPVKGALGYSHGLILYAPFYALVRPFLHPFTAYSVTLLLVMETGSLCLYALFRKFLGLRFLESLLVTGFFFSSINVINSWHTNVWSQTASIFLVPPILLLTLTCARMPARWPRNILAGLSGLLWTLLFTQDFYTGWFLLLISVLLLVGAALIFRIRPIVARAISAWRNDRPVVSAFIAGAAVGSLVFVSIYLGAYREQHGFPESQLLGALIPRDVPDWGHPFDAARSLVVYAGARSFELIVLVALLASLPWLKMPVRVRFATLWWLVVSAVVLLGAIKFNQYSVWRNYSVWKQLFRQFPGYSSIRDPKRIIYAYELAVAMLTGLFLAQLPKRSILRVLTAVLVLGLLIAEPNRETFHYGRPTETYDRWVHAPIAIDRSCESFFVQPASKEYESRAGDLGGLYGIDAMFIALNVSLPTLNGYSAWQPPGWSLANPPDPGYLEAVRQWIAGHHLHGVCQLDIDARTMTPYDPR